MSLEDALKENTAVMRELIEVLARTTLPEAQAKAPRGKKKADTPVEQAPAVETTEDTAPTPKAAIKPVKLDDAEPTHAVDYSHLATRIKSVVALGAEGRAEVVKILSSYGAETGKDLKPSQYAEVLDKVEAAHALLNDELA